MHTENLGMAMDSGVHGSCGGGTIQKARIYPLLAGNSWGVKGAVKKTRGIRGVTAHIIDEFSR
jgi:hypothetical protein